MAYYRFVRRRLEAVTGPNGMTYPEVLLELFELWYFVSFEGGK